MTQQRSASDESGYHARQKLEIGNDRGQRGAADAAPHVR